METLILVDESGHQIGTASRERCHAGSGLRHRAFVVFVFNARNELLVQLRANTKLGGGRWDVSATSHVRSSETFDEAIGRCLSRELGISPPSPAKPVLSYNYVERFDGRAENEHCTLFVSRFQGEIQPDPRDIDAVRYVGLDALADEMASHEEPGFTEWFRQALTRYRAHLESGSQRGAAGEHGTA